MILLLFTVIIAYQILVCLGVVYFYILFIIESYYHFRILVTMIITYQDYYRYNNNKNKFNNKKNKYNNDF